MKKYFYSMMVVLISMCFILSCDSNNTKDIKATKDAIGGNKITIEKYKDHTYIVMDSFHRKYGITHDPDCECKKEKVQ